MIIKKIETKLTSNDLFNRLRDEKYLVFLDSAKDKENLGRYSILVCNPRLVLTSKGKEIHIDDVPIDENDPFDALQILINRYKKEYKSDLPFIGGFVGYLSYDLKCFVENLKVTTLDDIDIPDMFFGLYDGAIVIDHLKEAVFITDAEMDNNAEKRIDYLETLIETFKENVVLKKHGIKCQINSNFTQEAYVKSVNKVRTYIRSGDIYQANMTQRFDTKLRDTPFELYEKLRAVNPAPFSSYIDFGKGHIVSSSPERFIRIKDKIIETRPIKGTRPRNTDKIEDHKNKEALINSEKDKSELLMIVDLERNDISKVAKTGSVKVTELFKLETYATVYHLVATIQGVVDDKYTIADCLKATFPGGSITGAPKIRAMEVIDELEPTSRSLYTGSIGYIDLNENLDLNIVIRTFICKDDTAYFQAGGGIVWDSDEEAEYQESLDKVYALKKALDYGLDH